MAAAIISARASMLVPSVGAGQVFLDEAHALKRDALAHRVEVRRAIGFQAMREGVHAGAGGDLRRHADGQFRIGDDHRGQHFRMEDDLLHMRFGIGDDAGAADFRAGAGRRRHGDDRRDAVGIGAGPPVADILEIPDRARLAGMKATILPRSRPGTAAEGDDAVMAAVAEDLQAGFEVLLVRVRIDLANMARPRPASSISFSVRWVISIAASPRSVTSSGLLDAGGLRRLRRSRRCGRRRNGLRWDRTSWL
jgi:hypothetical protein